MNLKKKYIDYLLNTLMVLIAIKLNQLKFLLCYYTCRFAILWTRLFPFDCLSDAECWLVTKLIQLMILKFEKNKDSSKFLMRFLSLTVTISLNS